MADDAIGLISPELAIFAEISLDIEAETPRVSDDSRLNAFAAIAPSMMAAPAAFRLRCDSECGPKRRKAVNFARISDRAIRLWWRRCRHDAEFPASRHA